MNSEIGNSLVTGAAGFIGSYLSEHLLEKCDKVTGLDNLATGLKDNLSMCIKHDNFKFLKEDLGNISGSNKIFDDIETVFHFAADPEVRTGYENPEVSYNQNIRNTFFLLQSIRKSNVKRIVFASSSSIYGDVEVLPTPENYGPLLPISAYGASKLACEALVSAFCNNYGIEGIIIRPANVIGKRGRHGLIWDLVNKIKNDSTKLEVLGDGTQKKSYIYISDAIKGIFNTLKDNKEKIRIYNLGSDDSVNVFSIAKLVCKNAGLDESIIHTSGGIDGGRGWKGDIKFAQLDISKLKETGWAPEYSSIKAVELTTKDIIQEVLV